MRNNKSSLPGLMIYKGLQSIIGQAVRAFNPAMHNIFKCFITHPPMESKSKYFSMHRIYQIYIYCDWQKRGRGCWSVWGRSFASTSPVELHHVQKLFGQQLISQSHKSVTKANYKNCNQHFFVALF